MQKELDSTSVMPPGPRVPQLEQGALAGLGAVHDIAQGCASSLNIIQRAEDGNVVHVEFQSSFAAAPYVHDLATFQLFESLGFKD